jgi:replicative DNA helicase
VVDVSGYLASKGLPLKRAGSKDVHTACMFCGEDPAARGRLYINIDPDAEIAGLFFCHRCQTKGSLATLKRHYGDQVRDDDLDHHTRLQIFNDAAAYYHSGLRHFGEVVEYLTGPQRGLLPETIKAHQLGYAPMHFTHDVATGETTVKRPNHLYRHLAESYQVKDILATGLCHETQNKSIVDALGGMVTIPYTVAGGCVAIRGRTWPMVAGDFATWNGAEYTPPPNKYKTCGGSSSRLFGTDACWDTDEVVVTEGECFPGDAEVLTRVGWVRFDKYEGQQVLQVHEDMTATFTVPVARVEKWFEGDLIVRSNKQRFFTATTPDHNLVSVWDSAQGQRLRKAPARDAQPGRWSIPRCVCVDGPGIPLSDDQIRLGLAVAADATIDVRKNTRQRARTNRYCRLGLRKQRKIDALVGTLTRLGIQFSAAVRPSDGQTSVCFGIPDEGYEYIGKDLPMEWIAEASLRQRRFICIEQALWDGNHVSGRRQLEFSSARHSQAVWMQTMASTAGYTSTVMARRNQWGEWFKVSLLLDKETTSWQSIAEAETVAHDDRVFCVQVPTGMILVRQNGCVSVSGNCDAMILEQHGFKAVAAPGATSWQESWDDYLTNIKRVWLLYDRDQVGEQAANRLVERLGTKVRRIFLSEEGTKCDPTEWFARDGHTAEEFEELLSVGRKGALLVSVREAMSEYSTVQSQPGVKFGWELFDIMMEPGLQAGQLMIILAKTGCLTGDTEIAVNRCAKGFKITLAKMHERWVGTKYAWDRTKPTFVQRADGGVVRLGEVSDVVYSGVKPVYEVTTTTGRAVKATKEHPFLTVDGWKKLGELEVGDGVLVNGGRSTKGSQGKPHYRKRSGLSQHPYRSVRYAGTNHDCVWTHRLVAEAELNQLDLDTFLSACRTGPIEGLTFLDPEVYAVHHIDQDSHNNDPANLKVLTHAEHWALHAADGAQNNVLEQVDIETVASVEYLGEQDTYDISMKDEPHNFMANGFAVHNSGKTILLLNLMHRARMVRPDLKILFVSLEQTRGEWWDRARRMHRFFDLDADEEDAALWWERNIMLVDRNRVTAAELRQVLDDFEYQMGGPPDLMCLDYLGYWARSFKGEAYQRTSDAVMAIKGIAKEFLIPTIVPHQVSRLGVDGQEFGPEAARDSGVVEETADHLLTMWSPDNTLGREEEEKTGQVHLRVGKSRHGGRGVLLNMQFAPVSLVMVPDGDPLCALARREITWKREFRDNWDKVVYRHRTGFEGHLTDSPLTIQSEVQEWR